jgi:nucleoside-diphosphate-sugar epimerase
MVRTIFLAGASGAIGRPLSMLLVDAGFRVVGTTRSNEGADGLKRLGVEPIVLDIFNEPAVIQAVAETRPEIIMNQLTALSALKSGAIEEALASNARIRTEGTPILVRAGALAGARRMISQSIAWLYAPGRLPHVEEDPLKAADGEDAVTVGGVRALEEATLEASPIEGVVLRYGWLYGPGTGRDEPMARPGVHVDAAASAALLSIDRAGPGEIYNVAEPLQALSSEKAIREFGWDPDFRIARTGQHAATPA